MTDVIECIGLGKAFPMGRRQPAEVLKHELLGGGAKYAKTFWALRHCDLRVREGEAVGIVGENGSGKSTLLQMIAGVYPATEGVVSTRGRVAALLELGSGFDPEYTGRQNVYMYGALLGLSREQIDARFDSIAGFADIGDFINQQVRTYSSGMFVRLAFAVAIHVDARILIVDEALAVGDARFAAKCMKRIEQLRSEGVTLLFVSHDVSAVRALCDRAIWLSNGATRAIGPVKDVTARYTEYLFGTEPAESPAELPADLGEPAATSPDEKSLPMDLAGSLNHWGSRKGMIVAASLAGDGGTPGIYEYGESLRLRVRLRVPHGLDTSRLSVAFSLKDLRGSDLMVCASDDEHPGVFEGRQGEVDVVFAFPLRLTPGKYMLVLAVEDRSGANIQYHEYVEGAMFFSTVSTPTRYGVFNLPVEIGVSSV